MVSGAASAMCQTGQLWGLIGVGGLDTIWLYDNIINTGYNSLIIMMMPKMNALNTLNGRNATVVCLANGFSLNWKT